MIHTGSRSSLKLGILPTHSMIRNSSSVPECECWLCPLRRPRLYDRVSRDGFEFRRPWNGSRGCRAHPLITPLYWAFQTNMKFYSPLSREFDRNSQNRYSLSRTFKKLLRRWSRKSRSVSGLYVNSRRAGVSSDRRNVLVSNRQYTEAF
jgi:hypothetical protein